MTTQSICTILKTLQHADDCQYNITFSFKIKTNETDKINSKIDRITSELIPPIIRLEDSKGCLFNIVWIQEIQDRNTYYFLHKKYINDEDIMCTVTIHGKFHKINSGYNLKSIESRNFNLLP